MHATALDVRELRTSFFTAGGEVEALRGITLAVRDGSMVGLVGESGSGKTTLARSIMGVVPKPGRVVAGSVSLYGDRIDDLAEEDLRVRRGTDISMIVPNPRAELNPLLSVGEQLAGVYRAHHDATKAEAREQALAMLERVRIPDPVRRLDAYPHELSGGMAQRVVIAMATICAPRVTISDDATSGLDVTVQAQILDLTRDLLKEQGSAVLMITRDLGVVANYCDRVAVLLGGRVVEEADVRTFFRKPLHPYSVELVEAFSYRATDQDWRGAEQGGDGRLVEVEPDHYVWRSDG